MTRPTKRTAELARRLLPLKPDQAVNVADLYEPYRDEATKRGLLMRDRATIHCPRLPFGSYHRSVGMWVRRHA